MDTYIEDEVADCARILHGEESGFAPLVVERRQVMQVSADRVVVLQEYKAG